MFEVEIVIVEGVRLQAPVGTKAAMADTKGWAQHVNGCGAGNARYDLVPDTFYGLSVKPVCNQHDHAWTVCDYTREDFDFWNKIFYENLNAWVFAKIPWWSPRLLGCLIRARTYFKAVQNFGWKAFKDCKKQQFKEK